MSAIPEKPGVLEVDDVHHGGARQDVVNPIDAMATAPGTTLESFAHLDEKKILRKVCKLLKDIISVGEILHFSLLPNKQTH